MPPETAHALAQDASLYTGRVTHQRLRPMRHRLGYRMYSLLLDLDALPALAARLRLFSLDRFNLFSLHQRDHGAGAGGLRAHVDTQLQTAGFVPGGRVLLLAMPRILGYAFNPLSVYFCHAPGGALQAVLYEVNNTFGERHSYLIAVDPAQQQGGRVQQRCAKQLHVSPFLDLDMRYTFRVEPPRAGSPLSIGIEAADAQGPVLVAHYAAAGRPLTDAALARVFFTHPLLTLKVIVAIHWQALQLWCKGARLRRQPAAPAQPITIVRTSEPL
jgi:DUF1365 family protein